MLRGLWTSVFRSTVSKSADRLILSHGGGALAMARHAARAGREDHRNDFWHRVVREIERRSIYRPF